MHTSAPTSPQLAVYAKLLCLLMVVICGAAAPMEEKVRLFNEKTKGFMEASRKGHFVSARNVTFSKFTNLTIRSTNEIGVVELVFADLTPHRRLCMDKNGKLKGMKKLSSKRRQPGCLFRECVDGMYFFYLTTHARPRLVGFHGREQFNPLGPPRCCDLMRGPDGEDGEHLVPDGQGRYTCQRRRAHRSQVDYFFFLKKRQENASLAEVIPAHNHRQGGHNHRAPHPPPSSTTSLSAGLTATSLADYLPRRRGGSVTTTDSEDDELPHPHRRANQPQRHKPRPHHQKQHKQHPPQPPPQQQHQPHRTRHHHQLTPLTPLTPLTLPIQVAQPRPSIRVRHRKVTKAADVQRDAASTNTNHLLWD